MQAVCGIAALVIFLSGVFMFRRAIKTGTVFDCLEGSETERTWISRTDNPKKFWTIIGFYIVIFSTFTVYLAQLSISGE